MRMYVLVVLRNGDAIAQCSDVFSKTQSTSGLIRGTSKSGAGVSSDRCALESRAPGAYFAVGAFRPSQRSSHSYHPRRQWGWLRHLATSIASSRPPGCQCRAGGSSPTSVRRRKLPCIQRAFPYHSFIITYYSPWKYRAD
jgi:hypothetical protein